MTKNTASVKVRLKNVLFSTDAPTVALSLGANLVPDAIAEGNDVYFECSISANPEVYKVVWLHNVSLHYINYVLNLSLIHI